MKQQHSLMKFDPATGAQKPYPSHSAQWREWHGKTEAWLFNPWTGERRVAGDVGSDTFGQLILPPGEPVYAAESKEPLQTLDGLYRDLLQKLGVQGHEGAVEEISRLRVASGLREPM